jgi:preprotein translocase subunit SecF
MDWMKYRKIYLSVSAILIAIGIFGLFNWGLNPGIDFRGGTIAEYGFEEKISTEEVIKKLESEGIQVFSVQDTGEGKYFFRLPALNAQDQERIKDIFREFTLGGGIEELRFETVGPSVGPELVKKTIYAAGIASLAILLWVTFQFKSFKFGVSAILAMFHDSFCLLGIYSILGYLYGAEVDFLFVTALLTTLSFSVHDTIVVYDRIREIQSKSGGEVYDIANRAVTETMVRSINNSFTIIFMLVALILLGGTTIKWFAVALFIGTVLGTYSSPFVSVPLIVYWEEVREKIKRKR